MHAYILKGLTIVSGARKTVAMIKVLGIERIISAKTFFHRIKTKNTQVDCVVPVLMYYLLTKVIHKHIFSV